MWFGSCFRKWKAAVSKHEPLGSDECHCSCPLNPNRLGTLSVAMAKGRGKENRFCSRRGDVVVAATSPAQSQRISSVMQWPLHLAANHTYPAARPAGYVMYVLRTSTPSPSTNPDLHKTNNQQANKSICNNNRDSVHSDPSVLTSTRRAALASTKYCTSRVCFSFPHQPQPPCLSKAIHSSTTDLPFFFCFCSPTRWDFDVQDGPLGLLA